ncbi:MAG: hypothetical protein ABI972_29045, partial [Acidobacteriota bacterium]
MRLFLSLMVLMAAGAAAQEMQFTPGSSKYLDAPRFPSGSWLRQHFDKPVPHVELHPPTRLGDFVVDSKLELSL